MSFSSWHNYGYGIRTDEIVTDADKVRALVHMAPKFEKEIRTSVEWTGEFKWEEITMDELEELFCEIDIFCGIATILEKVISECEGIELCACDDFNSVRYLLYTPSYPWQMTDKDKTMTEEKIRTLLKKYVSVLTEQSISFGYEAVENGG